MDCAAAGVADHVRIRDTIIATPVWSILNIRRHRFFVRDGTKRNREIKIAK
jgi:hypothetical protein